MSHGITRRMTGPVALVYLPSDDPDRHTWPQSLEVVGRSTAIGDNRTTDDVRRPQQWLQPTLMCLICNVGAITRRARGFCNRSRSLASCLLRDSR